MMVILVNCGCCCVVASVYGCAVWSTYGATGVQGAHSCTVRGGASDVRHDEHENFGDNCLFSRSSSTEADLVRDEVYTSLEGSNIKSEPC